MIPLDSINTKHCLSSQYGVPTLTLVSQILHVRVTSASCVIAVKSTISLGTTKYRVKPNSGRKAKSLCTHLSAYEAGDRSNHEESKTRISMPFQSDADEQLLPHVGTVCSCQITGVAPRIPSVNSKRRSLFTATCRSDRRLTRMLKPPLNLRNQAFPVS